MSEPLLWVYEDVSEYDGYMNDRLIGCQAEWDLELQFYKLEAGKLARLQPTPVWFDDEGYWDTDDICDQGPAHEWPKGA